MPSDFSTRLLNLREEARLTQAELGERVGVSQNQVYRWEKGSTPSVEMLIALAKEFDVTADYLIGLADERQEVVKEDNLTEDELELIKLSRRGDLPGALQLLMRLFDLMRNNNR